MTVNLNPTRTRTAPPPPTDAREAQRLSVARTHLLLDSPWFGNLAMRLQFTEKPDPRPLTDRDCTTFETNGTILAYNPAFSATLTDAELLGVMAHEVLHCALLHPYRIRGRKPRRWNRACDYAINALLIKQGFTLPKGALYDAAYENLSPEQIYPLLGPDEDEDGEPGPGGKQPDGPQDGPQGPGTKTTPPTTGGAPAPPNGQPDPNGKPDPNTQGKGKSQGPPNPCGSVTAPSDPADDPSGPEPMSEIDWQIATEQINAISQRAGTAPGNVLEAIKSNRAAQVPWTEAVHRFKEHALPCDVSWSTPNRRHIAADIYLPGTRKENMPRIGFAIDCSGSMTSRLLRLIAPEMTQLLHEVNPEALDLYLFDTAVREHIEYRPESTGEIELVAKGRGGTAFQPVFDYIAARPELTPACLIMFTDLDGPEPKEPPYPVLWITPESETARAWFGETVRISEYR